MASFVDKPGFQLLIHRAYGLGASLVIIGALFKLQHWTGAGIMLTIGMMTEFVIFILSAFEAMPKRYQWQNVYPQLLGGESVATPRANTNFSASSTSAPLDLGINASQVGDIKEGVSKLSSSINNLNALAAVAEESQKLTTNLINANQAVSAISSTSTTLSDAYKATAQIISSVAEESQKGASNMKTANNVYAEQVSAMSKNLGAINSSFELQLKDNQNYQQTYSALNKEMTTLVNDVKKSAESSAALSNQMAAISESVSKLNSVYGNMLTALTK